MSEETKPAETEAAEGVVRHGDGTSTVKLLKPIDLGGVTYEYLLLREATVDDLIKSDKAKGDMERGAILVSVISKAPMAVVRKIRSRDLERLMEEIDCLKND